jgi:hypothetical protein
MSIGAGVIGDEHAEESSEGHGVAQFGTLFRNATSVAAFNALLTLVQATGVTAPHPSEPHASEKNDQAVQVAAAALGQLSQQGPSNMPSLTPDASRIPQVQVRPICGYYKAHKNMSNIGPKSDTFCRLF